MTPDPRVQWTRCSEGAHHHLRQALCITAVAVALMVVGAGCGHTTSASRAAPRADTDTASPFDETLSGPAAWLGIDVEEQQLAPVHPDLEPGTGVIRTGSVAEGEGRLIRGVVAPGGWFSAPVAGDYNVHYSVGPSLCGPDLAVDRTLQIPAPGRYSLPALDEPLKIDCPADTPLQEGYPNPAVLALLPARRPTTSAPSSESPTTPSAEADRTPPVAAAVPLNGEGGANRQPW